MAQAKKPSSKASASSSPRSRRTYKAPALEKGLEILECLAAAPAPMTLQQLSLALERSASEIYRMLEVLVDQSYVLREAGLHRLSLKLFNLGVGQVPARDLLTVSLPVMEEVAQASRQALHLSVHVDRRLVVVASMPSPEPLGFGDRIFDGVPRSQSETAVLLVEAAMAPSIVKWDYLRDSYKNRISSEYARMRNGQSNALLVVDDALVLIGSAVKILPSNIQNAI